RVIGRVKHTAHEVVEFRWGGQTTRVTPGHEVWSADRQGWVGAHELHTGEMIRVGGNVVAPVEGWRRIPGLIEVYGIEVEYFHNYFVGTGDNAMLVHNGPACVVKPADPAAVVNALSDFRSSRFFVNGVVVLLDKKGMKHILERHHPNFWDGSVKASQSFFSRKTTIAEIQAAVGEVLKQNPGVVSEIGPNGAGQMTGVVNGVRYQLGLNRGRVGQFFPLG
ncbi:MAG: hypothetical protein ACRC7O_05670, partial [Fimbriiglobus sp.]